MYVCVGQNCVKRQISKRSIRDKQLLLITISCDLCCVNSTSCNISEDKDEYHDTQVGVHTRHNIRLGIYRRIQLGGELLETHLLDILRDLLQIRYRVGDIRERNKEHIISCRKEDNVIMGHL
ncbi:hypothetical protein ACJX0J_005663 [Zea mays]